MESVLSGAAKRKDKIHALIGWRHPRFSQGATLYAAFPVECAWYLAGQHGISGP